MAKTIIQVATTGAITPKKLNPAIPCTPKEIAEVVYDCWKAGAAVAHLHMRDDNEMGCMDPAKFKETCERIRDMGCDIIFNLTTAGGPVEKDSDRWLQVIENLPEMCTYDCGSFNWLPGGPYINSTQFLKELGQTCQQYGVKPEIECFDVGQINAAIWFMQNGFLKAPLHFDFALGVKGAAQATPEMVKFMKEMLPADSTWCAFGIGQGHLPVMFETLVQGGHVRVGLEDNVYYAKGQLATNVQLVERAARVIREFNNEVATPDEAREILGLKKK